MQPRLEHVNITVGDADRREIEGRMRREVLETATYPEIAYHTEQLAIESGQRIDLKDDLTDSSTAFPFTAASPVVERSIS